MDIKEELPKLKSKLCQYMSKIEKRTNDGKQTIIQDYIAENSIQERTHAELLEKASQVKQLYDELETLNITVDGQLHEKEQLCQNLDQTQKGISKQHELLVREEKAMEEKLKELNRAVDFFRDCLGLTFKKTSGNRLQTVFTCIDHKEPECPFYFFMEIKDGKYIISDCEPQLPDLDRLVDKLNNTNNLRAFIVAVRKQFKKMVGN